MRWGATRWRCGRSTTMRRGDGGGGLSAPRPAAPPEDISETEEGTRARYLTSRGAAPVTRGRRVAVPAAVARRDALRHGGRGFHPARDDRDACWRRATMRARRAAIAAWNAGQPLLKRGIAFTPVKFGISFTLTHLNQAGALVHVYQDGSVHLNHGGTEMGQGLFQKVAQVAAARFGVDVGRGEDHRDGYGQGAQYLGHGGLVGVGSERHGGAGRLRHDPRPDGGLSGRAAPGDARSTCGSRMARCRWRRRDELCRRGDARPIENRVSLSCHGVLQDTEDRPGTGSRARGGRSSISPMARR